MFIFDCSLAVEWSSFEQVHSSLPGVLKTNKKHCKWMNLLSLFRPLLKLPHALESPPETKWTKFPINAILFQYFKPFESNFKWYNLNWTFIADSFKRIQLTFSLLSLIFWTWCSTVAIINTSWIVIWKKISQINSIQCKKEGIFIPTKACQLVIPQPCWLKLFTADNAVIVQHKTLRTISRRYLSRNIDLTLANKGSFACFSMIKCSRSMISILKLSCDHSFDHDTSRPLFSHPLLSHNLLFH